MRQPLVVGNWKMNGLSDGVRALCEGVVAGAARLSHVSIAVCPPFVYLPQVRALLAGSEVGLGAQDVAKEKPGAFTGEIAAEMLVDIGCQYAIVGHSERRTLYQESSNDVAVKCGRLLEVGVTPIICLGEQFDERKSGATEEVVGEQLDSVLEQVGVSSLQSTVIAYEPVWAIGTGETATPEQANDVHRLVRERIAAKDAQVASEIRILYGGSVKPENAGALFAMPDIDGGLIGGASLQAADFLAICAATG